MRSRNLYQSTRKDLVSFYSAMPCIVAYLRYLRSSIDRSSRPEVFAPYFVIFFIYLFAKRWAKMKKVGWKECEKEGKECEAQYIFWLQSKRSCAAAASWRMALLFRRALLYEASASAVPGQGQEKEEELCVFISFVFTHSHCSVQRRKERKRGSFFNREFFLLPSLLAPHASVNLLLAVRGWWML